jgi:hypothetical protein
MVRIGLVVWLAAACDHEPPPRERAAAPAPVEPPIDAAAVAVAPPIDAAAAPAGPDEVTCAEVAEHVTTVLVDNSADPKARRTTAQRGAILKRLAISCRDEKWPEAGIACLRKATTQEEVKKCDDVIHPRP